MAVGNIAEDAIRRIGALMGDEVSPEHTAMLYGLLERVAHATGPQLVMSFGDEGPDGP